MSALAARFELERSRLWGASACVVVLAHLGLAALLLLHFNWRQPALAGTADALDVEIASPSALLAGPSTAVAQLQQPARRAPPPQLAAFSTLNPIPQLQPIPQQQEEPQPLSVTPAQTASAMLAAAEASVVPIPDLTTVPVATLGQANVPPSPEQLWLAQVIARLQRYKSYPRSAVKRRRQDTVMLRFTVNHAGHILDSGVDSMRHYRVLENEAKKMLRLAAPLPALPQQLTADQIVVRVPINFALVSSKSSSGGTHCVKPADAGPAPAGATATLAQMQAYRRRLNQYIAAARSELDCLGGAGTADLADRDAAMGQVQRLVDRFNVQARAFQAKAAARALQAQRARQAAAAALLAQATRGYAACTPPTARSAATLTGDSAQAYRKQLLGYAAAVRVYLACVNQVQRTSVAQAGGVLTADQLTELGRTATQLANAAVLPFDQLAARFNSQLKRAQKQEALAGARERDIQGIHGAPEVFFPNSTWDTPAPLPAGNCFSIVRVGPTYQARLCKGTYVTEKFVHGVSQAPGGPPVSLGTVSVPPDLETAEMQNSHPTTIAYAIGRLRVSAAHLIMTINRKSDAPPGAQDNWDSIHFDLVLSADGRRLVGHCWTAQKRWDCQLPRHH
ncbi:MAG: energy transducer TonB [Steroidobacteraceae bacterium]